MEGILFILALAGFAFFVWRRLPRYLHILQQDDYDGRRFLKWLVETRTFDRRVSLALLVAAGIGWLFSFTNDDLLFALIFAGFAAFEADPRKEAKKKLVMTSRARRIFTAGVALNILSGAIALSTEFSLAPIIAVQIMPLLLALGNILLAPVETRIQEKIMCEASERLAKINPHIIGVTGSFGKTSVKHILGHILELNAETFYTPGSVNTLMGISRMIRQSLPSDCQYFLVEMGAYGEGSIRKLCTLTPPQTGIITALGEAHYERFKSLDTVARAKFELAEAVLGHGDGKIIIHENVLAQDYAAQFIQKDPARFLICGRGVGVDLRIEGVEQTASGLTVHVKWEKKGAAASPLPPQGGEGQGEGGLSTMTEVSAARPPSSQPFSPLGGEKGFTLTAPLFGAHHADNMAIAFATAVTLGIAPDRAVAALRSAPQIKHRLEVKPQANGIIYIDDAFNSNPSGFNGALEVMTMLASEKPRRRIIVTPGLVELGEKHDSIHHDLGVAAAKHADIAIAVRPERIQAFIDGFRSAKPDGTLHTAVNLAEAQKWLAANAQPDDIVLLENDLPDVYERKLAI